MQVIVSLVAVLMRYHANTNCSVRYSVLVQVSNPLNQSFSSKIKYSGYVDQTSSTSIDDEYAPSVFTKSHLKWKMVDNQHSQSHFWLWRTVCTSCFNFYHFLTLNTCIFILWIKILPWFQTYIFIYAGLFLMVTLLYTFASYYYFVFLFF